MTVACLEVIKDNITLVIKILIYCVKMLWLGNILISYSV